MARSGEVECGEVRMRYKARDTCRPESRPGDVFAPATSWVHRISPAGVWMSWRTPSCVITHARKHAHIAHACAPGLSRLLVFYSHNRRNSRDLVSAPQEGK